jgi:hypothetical protein
MSCVFFISACSDSGEQLKNIAPPESGGLITKFEGGFAVVVRYKDGRVGSTTAKLIEKKDPIGKGSVDALFTFNVDGCGYLEFIKPPLLSAVLNPLHAENAHQEPNCIITGGVENSWNIKL